MGIQSLRFGKRPVLNLSCIETWKYITEHLQCFRFFRCEVLDSVIFIRDISEIATCWGRSGPSPPTRKSFLRQAFVAYDLEVGVYGVMFCEEMHFRYEIVDDLLGLAYKPCGHGGSLQYARSTDRNEIWVSMLEKAYFKYMGCLEECWGGYGGDAVFAFLGGVWGTYDVNGKPYSVWETLNRGHQNGDWAWASRIFSVFVEFVVI